MAAFPFSSWAERFRLPRGGLLLRILSGLALAGLIYLGGAASMYFELPSSGFLKKAFVGARAWYQRERGEAPPRMELDDSIPTGVTVDRPGKTWDGYTLYTTAGGSQAALIDMRGNLIHQWQMPFRQAFPRTPHVRSPLPDEQVFWFRCHLYPNGDLLAVYQVWGDTPYGYGLVKLDKDSKLLWAYAGHVHHDVDVGEDGTIYALSQTLDSKAPSGVETVLGAYIADALVVLSPEGRELKRVPLLKALRDSPYSLLLSSPRGDGPLRDPSGRSALSPSRHPGPPSGASPPANGMTDNKGDALHANSVRVLRRSLAGKFPLFRAGQVLTSFRSLDTIAVVDVEKGSVVWASRGPWQAQHDPEFLPNGNLLLYDNNGGTRSARVLEYNPRTQAIPWYYANENSRPFSAPVMGMKQRLPNGNTLIVHPDLARLFEVTPEKELVWEVCSLPPPGARTRPGFSSPITGARRYAARELTFLEKGLKPRPK
jgi:hypothetical protein